jgi:very-short-patch-repair endonuclease
MAVDAVIAELAARQHGLVTHRQLRRLGLSDSAIKHRVATGRLHRLHVGVFSVGHDLLSDRAVLLAAVMACGRNSALSHLHAAHVFGLLPRWTDLELRPTHVTIPRDCARGRRPGILVHRAALPAAEITIQEGIPITTPARTILDCGAITDDRTLELIVDQAITDEATSITELHAIVRRHEHTPGAAALSHLLAAAERFDSVSDSRLAEAFVKLVRDARLPEPVLNHRIGQMRVDAGWPAERVAVELDGYRWHRTRARQETDRRREAALRRFGWLPVRFSYRQVFNTPVAVAADIAAVLAGRRA